MHSILTGRSVIGATRSIRTRFLQSDPHSVPIDRFVRVCARSICTWCYSIDSIRFCSTSFRNIESRIPVFDASVTIIFRSAIANSRECRTIWQNLNAARDKYSIGRCARRMAMSGDNLLEATRLIQVRFHSIYPRLAPLGRSELDSHRLIRAHS